MFSLGCGRVFEGTHQDMFKSLNKLKKLPLRQKYIVAMNIQKNLDFCKKFDPNKIDLEKKK